MKKKKSTNSVFFSFFHDLYLPSETVRFAAVVSQVRDLRVHDVHTALAHLVLGTALALEVAHKALADAAASIAGYQINTEKRNTINKKLRKSAANARL